MSEPSYSIIGQQEVLDFGGPTGAIRAMEVKFQTTGSNVVASVRVPLDQYRPDVVASMIQAYVNNIDAVHKLGTE